MSDLTLPSRQRRRNLAAAFGCTSAAAVTMGITWPLLALILHGQGLSDSVIGLSSASQSLAVFAAAPLAPRLIARAGLVRSIIASIAGVIAMLLLLPLTGNVYAWFPIRFLLGASASTLFLATETWVNAVAKEETRGRTIGIFGFLWSAAFAAGPLLIRATGTEGWTPFIVGAALVLFAAMPLLGTSDAAPVVHGHVHGSIMRFARLLPAAMMSALLLGAVDYILDAFLPLYALHAGMTEAASVTLLTVLLAGVTTAQLPAGWLADRLDRQHLLFGLTALSMTFSLLLPISISRPWAAYPAVLAIGAGLGGIWTVSVVMVGSRFRGADLSAAYAAGGVLHGMGMVLGPIIAGFASAALDPVVIPLLVALFCLFYLPAALVRPAGKATKP
jgi:MFS family permease